MNAAMKTTRWLKKRRGERGVSHIRTNDHKAAALPYRGVTSSLKKV